MRPAHKNECPVAAGQVVKTVSKRTADFIAKLAPLVALDAALLGGWVLLLTVAIRAVEGALQ